MDNKWHELVSYQNYLISKDRESVVPNRIYDDFISLHPPTATANEPFTVLDFGCGMGYTSVYLAHRFQKVSTLKIYSCDYQEKLLDQLWYRLVKQKLSNVTPFYMSSHPTLYFPTWLPLMDHIILSFSLSTCKNINLILNSIKKIMKPISFLHIIDWDVSKKNSLVDVYVRKEAKIALDTLLSIIQENKYQVFKNYKVLNTNIFFAVSIKL